MSVDAVGFVALSWASMYAGACASAALRASRLGEVTPTSAARASRMVILRPCAGAERWLHETLASTEHALGARGALVIFAVADEADEATPIAREAARELVAQGFEARVVVTRAIGPNRKAEQLARALAEVPSARDRVIVVDSDVDLRGVDLGALAATLDEGANVGACWIPPVEDAHEGTFADRVSGAVLGASLHSFPLLRAIDRTTLVGKTFAVRRATLERIGGFEALRCVLGEDLELARRVRALGERVVALGGAVRSRAAGRSIDVVVARFARWLTVLRGQRPSLLLTYPLLFSAAPLIALVALVHPGPASLAALLLALAVRLGTALVAQRVGGAKVGPGIVVWSVVGDVILLAALARAVWTRRVAWRGRALLLGPGGVLRDAGG